MALGERRCAEEDGEIKLGAGVEMDVATHECNTPGRDCLNGRGCF